MGEGRPFLGWRMAALAFLAQNLALGMIYGLFGAVVAELERQVGMTRVQSSLGFSTMVLALGLGSAAAGALLSRRGVRWALSGAFALQAAALVALSLAQTYPHYLLVCIALGTVMALAGIIGPLLLVSRWFDARRAFALAIVNLPIALSTIPIIAGFLLPQIGLPALLHALAALALAAGALLALFVVERPADVGQSPLGATGRAQDQAAGGAGESGGSFLADPRFWLLALATSVLNAGGSAFFAHIIPYAMEAGHPLQSAALLASAFGFAGIVGTLACGWIADRIGALWMLAAISAIACAFWTTIPLSHELTPMIGQCVVYGAFLGGLVAIQGTAVGELFRPDQIGRVAGSIFTAQLPVVFTLPPLIGEIRARTGDYGSAFALLGALSLMSMLVLGAMAYRLGQPASGARA